MIMKLSYSPSANNLYSLKVTNRYLDLIDFYGVDLYWLTQKYTWLGANFLLNLDWDPPKQQYTITLSGWM